MTQLQSARSGVVTAAMKIVAADEGVDVEAVRAAVASGEAVIPLNIHHRNACPVGVGRLFSTKVNANLGRSVTHSGRGDELEKLKLALAQNPRFRGRGALGRPLFDVRPAVLCRPYLAPYPRTGGRVGRSGVIKGGPR